MTKEQFQDPSTDMMEVYFFYYTIMGGKISLSFEQFREVFSHWIFNVVGIGRLANLQYYVIKQLNKHFEI